jgi:DNA-binding MarR family transcriptional regulator
LLEKELVMKNTCPNDNRLVDVSITDKGKKLLEKMDGYDDEMDGIFDNLTEADVKAFNKLMDKLRAGK